jgi:hypothetical protein
VRRHQPGTGQQKLDRSIFAVRPSEYAGWLALLQEQSGRDDCPTNAVNSSDGSFDAANGQVSERASINPSYVSLRCQKQPRFQCRVAEKFGVALEYCCVAVRLHGGFSTFAIAVNQG